MTFLDICAEIGGFRYGFEQAGHPCIGFIEKDKFAKKSYRAMYDTEKEWFSDDVTKLESRAIPYADIWFFGFPCQSVSLLGRTLRNIKKLRNSGFRKVRPMYLNLLSAYGSNSPTIQIRL